MIQPTTLSSLNIQAKAAHHQSSLCWILYLECYIQTTIQIIINVCIFKDKLEEYYNSFFVISVPPCGTQRCHCNVKFGRDILYVNGSPYQSEPHVDVDRNLTIQFIEFMDCNVKFSLETFEGKNVKCHSLIQSITSKEWNIDPLIINIAGARPTPHILSK